MFEGRLDEVLDLYDDPGKFTSPSNIWPVGQEWLVTTNWDLLGTRVCGSEDLVAALVDDPDLEAVMMNVEWYPVPDEPTAGEGGN